EEGIRFFGLDPNRFTVLVFGGSLGAVSMNSAILNGVGSLREANMQLIWQTGKEDIERIRTAAAGMRMGWIGSFIDAMEYAYAAADLVVCRAGAMTLAELTAVGAPAVLVPYPYAAGNHQTFNARTLARAGAAVVVNDHQAPQTLVQTIVDLSRNPDRLRAMREACRRLARPDVAGSIAGRIIAILKTPVAPSGDHQ
ncbi:MAG: glycosyltransferase, partial [Bacteroidota bacterium]